MQESGDGSGQGGHETFGSVPGGSGSGGSGSGGSETFGTVPPTAGGSETFGTTPQPPSAPASGGNRNVGLLVGGVIAVLVVIAAIVGFSMK
jgi:hypothetical protein